MDFFLFSLAAVFENLETHRVPYVTCFRFLLFFFLRESEKKSFGSAEKARAHTHTQTQVKPGNHKPT